MSDQGNVDTKSCKHLTKRQIKQRYMKGEIGLSDAIPYLMFDHAMDRGEALKYLGL